MNHASMSTAVLIAVLSASPLLAQDASLTLDAAIERFERSSVELELAGSRLSHDLASARQGRAASNPVASITREDLGEYSEEYFNLTQRADFLWLGGARGRRADALASSARAAFRADSADAVLHLKRTFVEAWSSAETLLAMRETDEVLEDVLADARARLELGDIAGFDVRRIAVARATLAMRIHRRELEVADAERRLGAMTSADGTTFRLGARAPTTPPPDVSPALDVVQQAMGRRPELDGARAATDASSAEVGLARGSRLEGVGLTGGYKRQSDGRDGLFVGLQLSLPLVDRRSGAIEAARAGVAGSRSTVELLSMSIARQAQLAEAAYRGARGQRELFAAQGIVESEQLLESARTAYDEGEGGVLELVDAAETYLDARLLIEETRAMEWMAYFVLEHAVGGFAGDTGEDR